MVLFVGKNILTNFLVLVCFCFLALPNNAQAQIRSSIDIYNYTGPYLSSTSQFSFTQHLSSWKYFVPHVSQSAPPPTLLNGIHSFQSTTLPAYDIGHLAILLST